MKVLLIKNEHMYSHLLPLQVKDNFWITDIDNFNNIRNLINIVAKDNCWFLKSNYETHIVSTKKEYDEVPLIPYNFYTIKNDVEKDYYYIYALPDVEKSYISYKVLENCSLTIGNNPNNNISYDYALLDDLHAKLDYNNHKWQVIDNNSKFGVYVNDTRILNNSSKNLKYGDIVFIGGLKIIVMKDFILINNINNKVLVSSNSLQLRENNPKIVDESPLKDEILSRSLYAKEDYFYRSPRFIEDIIKAEITIEDPPAKINNDETSLMMVIGPMFTMALTSLTTAFTTINNITNGDTTWKKAAPSLIVAASMFASMLIWPLITRVLDRKKKKKKEKERIEKYNTYLDSKKKEIESIINKQSQILKDKYITLEECQNIILRKKNNLWERSLSQQDFLSLRLGIGNVLLDANINYSKEKFSLEEDELKKKISEIVNSNNMLNDVPIKFSLVEKYVTSIIGHDELTYEFFKSLLLQMITFQSYELLKIVILTNEENVSEWDYLRNLPYLFDDSKHIRFLSTTIDETRELSLYLEKIYQDRKASNSKDMGDFSPYYLVITDNYHIYRDVEIVKDILIQQDNKGFGLIMFSDKLQNLPSECKNFINVNKDTSGIFESEVTIGNQKEFKTEFCNNEELEKCIKKICNIPIEFDDDDKQLPNVIPFLEMYNVGNVKQLNVYNRWNNNNSQKSLAVPVGIEKSGTLLKLDLHEKYHGPHGLIAGMTGSGKSEFIITYILSLAVNFSPLDVSFILIDYKGGGLAGAFENRETGVKLPHLVGTITNLDVGEMNRSLSSIQSELRRRQKIFNKARDKLGESTVDIYKYQKFYKAGMVSEPVAHLFIISDEFAELKSQQPEFMDELISVARIGRSLGIHLILATQKPSGVVNDQIWSNSRFRVCLKVQDKSDSNEMIKSPDAALLKQVGRFYLQVGYNELFVLGQSAWCGAKYVPTEKLKKKLDLSVLVIDNIGNVLIASGENREQEVSEGEELGSVLKEIIEVSRENNVYAKQLWLEKIPEEIFADKLMIKYNYQSQPFVINPIIGEYDDPSNQFQNMVTLNLTEEGNTAIYGSSGSGKELLLTTMIYSIITNHATKEVNIYILDFGAGTLSSFRNAPQVGDVVLSTEEDKIKNLFKMIEEEIENRKKLFINYNGDYEIYCKKSGNTIPYIIIFINNYDAFQDMYDYEETINKLTRECAKYGIIIVTTVNTTSGMRYRLRQNFKSDIALQFNDQDDYSSILGNVHHLYPDNKYGRGLIKLNEVYEFQTARPCKLEDLSDFINEQVEIIKKKELEKASKIPIVPEHIYVSELKDKVTSTNNVLVGINKNTIKPELFNFKENYTTIVTSANIDNIKDFSNALVSMLTNIKDTNIIVFDVENMLSINKDNIIYANNDLETILKKLSDNINYANDIYVKDNYSNKNLANSRNTMTIILNYNKFILKIGNDNKKLFEDMIVKAKDINIFDFILIDQYDKFKKLEYDAWYKAVINSSYGIYVGNGINDQSLLKTDVGFKRDNNELPNGYGIIIKNSKINIVKLIEKDINEEEII